MSKKQIQLNLYWEDPEITEGLNYVEAFEKRNFVLSSESELNDIYSQIKQVLVDFFTT